MSKGVLETKAGSVYDDDIVQRYHFPRRYLSTAKTLIGDWIVYREPKTGGGRGCYVAAARVARINPDPERANHHYARIDSFLPFDTPVPLSHGGIYYEATLRAVRNPSAIGTKLQGRSVRAIPDADFAAIVRMGLNATLFPGNAPRLGLDPAHADADTRVLLDAPAEEQEHRIVQLLTNRKVRDASFRQRICEAYDSTCAVTRLRIVNGGGKAEAQAAHIWPVQDGGPDTVQNGLALSSTAHWLFDRHLISLTDELGLLVSHNKVPAELRTLFQGQLARIHLPKDERLWPNLAYVRRHREAFAA